MRADIITIGDEILIGQIVDSNSAFIAAELDSIGISVRQIISISDKNNAIKETLHTSLKHSDLVILTGGLGPTNDDITKKALADYFQVKIIRNYEVLKHIERMYNPLNLKLTEINMAQADVPENCTILFNRTGSAPGMLFELENKRMVVSMPGVPFEMKTIVKEELIPYIKTKFVLPIRMQKTFLTTGVAESVMSERLEMFEKNIPTNFSLAYLPSPGLLRLRLSATGDTIEFVQKEFIQQQKLLEEKLGNDLFGYNNDSLGAIVGNLLSENKFTVSSAESCTGGNIAKTLAGISGASQYFTGGIVAYDNKIKIKNLEVNASDIEIQGAVSEKVVVQMAEGARKNFGTDFSIATSGIAGPTGGTSEKPVGTVWIAISSPKSTLAMKFMLGEHRGRTIERSTIAALNMLRITIKKIVEKTVEKV